MTYISVSQCLAQGTHLKDTDDDGYCNHCGYQETGETMDNEKNITANVHINDGSGVTDYYFTDQGQAKVLRINRTNDVELRGDATNAEWAELINAMIEDRFSVKGSW